MKITFVLFCLIVISVPLAVTTYLNNQSDLPKSALLQITGSLFMLSVIFIYFKEQFRERENSEIELPGFSKELDPYIIFFLLAALLSTVFSMNSRISFFGQYERQYGLTLLVFSTMIYFFSASVYTAKKNIQRLLFITELVSLCVATYAVLQWSGLDPFELQPFGDKRPVSFLGNAVFTGGFLAMNLPVSLLNVTGKKNIFIKILFPLVIAFGIAATGTRSAFMAVIAMLAVLAVFYPVSSGMGGDSFRKKIKVSILILFAGFVAAVVMMLLFNSNPFVQRVASIFSSGDNPRFALWRDSINAFLKYPLFGCGPGMFPNAIEEFYSIRLRNDEIKRYFDNAHNNYIQILCTMGLTGLIAYLLVLFSSIRACVRNIFSRSIKENKFLSLALLCSIVSYAVYGLTNFDEIAITLYLFLYLSIIRFSFSGSTLKSLVNFKGRMLPVTAISVLIVSFCSFSVYNAVNNVKADRYYLEGVKGFSSQRFNEGVNSMNTAILLNSSCGYYRFNLASAVYSFAASNYKLSRESKTDLLNQAAQEMLRARRTYISMNQCDAILAMIYYELNDLSKADSIKAEVLKRDPLSISFRLNLIVYYSNAGQMDKARDNLEIIQRTGFESTRVWNAAAYFYFKSGDKEKASLYYNKILSVEPENNSVRDMLNKLR